MLRVNRGDWKQDLTDIVYAGVEEAQLSPSEETIAEAAATASDSNDKEGRSEGALDVVQKRPAVEAAGGSRGGHELSWQWLSMEEEGGEVAL